LNERVAFNKTIITVPNFPRFEYVTLDICQLNQDHLQYFKI